MFLLKKVKRYLFRVVQKEKKPFFFIPFFFLISAFFSLGVRLRHLAYDKGLLKVHKLPTCVVSIGNIAAGGTGKTPLIQKMIKHLDPKIRLAILTRGFLSKIETSGRVEKISDGKGCTLPVQYCGDEPYLLAKTTSVPIWVGKNRIESGYRAITEKMQCLILDDGMQYRRLARNLEIIVIDAKDPFGQKKFLPSGLLRDTPSRLDRADWIIANHIDSACQYEELKKEISLYTLAPVIGMNVVVCNPQEVTGKKVGVFCALGRPERFLQTVREIGCGIVDCVFLPDHTAFGLNELNLFAKRCKDKAGEMIVCTEKDWVKLSSFRCCIPVIALRVELEIVAGHAIWQEMLAKIEFFSNKGHR
ncbi:Tetraacyldisaccharide 4'-kinase [Candidatus Rhabdochlamydia oedothoracis]|uniref:Tetraacyldisaccharide 4'-kinase n=1 Tax=Candidatus Rhabdochlamydia oedothoracis TaxID=2720720 RepID=A0ABX8V2H1_9BACT|nr:Tetraacyldisaccharide 4'-kinase [Candidatus Rhabdochlamydia sp. W815]QYF49384.1 Tetraacyldisaccharide 4'-kinase [Candidatus Rhabdochlamydia oedothoracis]